VRRVLDAAFALPPSVSDTLTRAFGADLSKTRGHGADLSAAGFRDPAKMAVATLPTGSVITLDDALGDPDPGRLRTASHDRSERLGTYAWQLVLFGTTGDERAATVLRVKKSLNAGFPVPMDWYPAWKNFDQRDGSFHGKPDTSGGGGWHVSLLHDYQVSVPGYGVIPVGTPVHDPAVLAKTLAPEATIDLLRIKNSWGREFGPLGAPGYDDLTWEYLTTDFVRNVIDYDEHASTGPALEELILPPPTWDGAGH
jgi:hypothetical protein